MKNWVATAVAFTVLVGAIAGAVDYFAKDADLTMVAARLDQKIKSDQMFQTQQRIWQLEDRNQARDCEQFRNDADKAECRLLKLKLEILQRELSK